MLRTGRHLYVVFMCHLALKKMLKAHIELHEDKFPPKIHDLRVLLERAELEIPATNVSIIKEIDKESVATRYPEDLQIVIKHYTKGYCSQILKQTEKTIQWLRSHPRLSKL